MLLSYFDATVVDLFYRFSVANLEVQEEWGGG